MEIRITVPDEIASLAAKAGLGTEDYVEQLLGKILASSSREESQVRLREELLADWDHYLATGLHITDEEVDGWLTQLEAGEAVEPPALHP